MLHGGRGMAYAALIAGVLCISGSALFVKLAGVPGPVSAFYRFLITGLVLVPWWLSSGAARPSGVRLWLTLAGGIFLALDLILWNTSIMLTTASTATLLGNNAPIWVGLGAWLIFRERLSGRYWFGLLTALAGMALVVGTTGWSASGPGKGDLMAVAAGFFYGAYLLTTQKARSSIDTLTFMTFSVAAGTVLLLVLNLSLGLPLAGYGARSWAYLAALALVSHLGGWLAVNYALGHLKASAVSVSLLAQVVVTAALAAPLLGEHLTLRQLLGGGLVLAGIYLVISRRRVT
ncbi:membrane protein [Geobacter sp. SVR]|nr:membrane protein [Geobacter sp. SVR]GCF84180.1 membrane protein [Geobacter sp. SVR]